MTRKEKEYLKYIQQSEEFQRKAQEMKIELERERDALVVSALNARQITRAEGAKLAKLIRDKESFAKIMEMDLLPDKMKEVKSLILEDAGLKDTNETESEDEDYDEE